MATGSVAATLVAAAGMVCDWLVESLYIGWFPEHLETVDRTASLLTGGVANGLYTIGGIILTLATPAVRGYFGLWTWTTWGSGIVLSLAAFAGSVHVMVAATGLLFGLFCPWCFVMGRKLI